jgi:hypothetical protein
MPTFCNPAHIEPVEALPAFAALPLFNSMKLIYIKQHLNDLRVCHSTATVHPSGRSMTAGVMSADGELSSMVLFLCSWTNGGPGDSVMPHT